VAHMNDRNKDGHKKTAAWIEHHYSICLTSHLFGWYHHTGHLWNWWKLGPSHPYLPDGQKTFSAQLCCSSPDGQTGLGELLKNLATR
jgi:hypothetical protein